MKRFIVATAIATFGIAAAPATSSAKHATKSHASAACIPGVGNLTIDLSPIARIRIFSCT